MSVPSGGISPRYALMSCTLMSFRDSRVGMGVGVGVGDEVGLGDGVGSDADDEAPDKDASCVVPDSVFEDASSDNRSDIPLISALLPIPPSCPVLPCPWLPCPSLPAGRAPTSLPAMRPMPRPITPRARTSNIVSRILFLFFLFFTVPPMMALISLSLRQPLSLNYINVNYPRPRGHGLVTAQS